MSAVPSNFGDWLRVRDVVAGCIVEGMTSDQARISAERLLTAGLIDVDAVTRGLAEPTGWQPTHILFPEKPGQLSSGDILVRLIGPREEQGRRGVLVEHRDGERVLVQASELQALERQP